jgi:tetratricopeptide (TPR) repeat protein
LPVKPWEIGTNVQRGKIRTVCAVCHRMNWHSAAPLVDFCRHCGHPLVDAQEIEHIVQVPPPPPAPRPPTPPTGVMASLGLGREYRDHRRAQADFAAGQKRYEDASKNWREQAFAIRERVVAESIWSDFHRRLPPDAVERMTGIEFEGFLCQVFAKMGYSVRTTPASGDQGGDLILTGPATKESVVVQAKRSARPVSNRAVQEVIGAMAYYGCSAGIVVTNGEFTSAALSLAAREKRLAMWDGSKLAAVYAENFPTSPLPFDRTSYEHLIERLRRNPRRATAKSLSGRWQDQAATEAQVALLWRKAPDYKAQFKNWRALFAFAIDQHRKGDEAWSKGGISLRLDRLVRGEPAEWDRKKGAMKLDLGPMAVAAREQPLAGATVGGRSHDSWSSCAGKPVEPACAEALAGWDRLLAANPEDCHALRGKGLALQGLGRFEEALQAFDAALTVDSADPVVWHHKGRALEVLGRSEEALKALHAALTLDPTYAAALRAKGVVLSGLGRFVEASQAFDDALAEPTDAVECYMKGLALLGSGRLEEALKAFEAALTITPNDTKAWYGKGYTLQRLGRLEESLTAYDGALATDSDYAAASQNKAAIFDSLNRDQEALAAYDHALSIDPGSAECWSGKGWVLCRLNRDGDAVAAFDQALSINAIGNHRGWAAKGFALRRCGRYVEALAAYERTLAIEPVQIEYLRERGILLAILKRSEEALTALDQALAKSPEDKEAWWWKGMVFIGTNPKEAFDAFQRSAEIGGREWETWSALGGFLMGFDHPIHVSEAYQRALASCERRLAQNPNDSEVWRAKGQTLAEMDRHTQALEAFERALSIDPEDAEAWLHKGNALEKLGRVYEALTAYEHVATVDPETGHASLTYAYAKLEQGTIFQRLGYHEQALKAYDLALAIRPYCATTWFNKATVLEAAGRTHEALEAYEHVLSINPDHAEAISKKTALLQN